MKTENRWERLKRLFEETRQLEPEQRQRYLEQACPEDPELRREVEQLLEAGENSDEALHRIVQKSAPPAAPAQIGPYRILRELGQGGMGIVYLAEQSRPVQRSVALKLVPLGMQTKEVMARFELERQALALMQHPHIAQVFDAGATSDGRPYFAMEYVQGPPVTEFCDRGRLGLRQRLELFIQVCRAVQHAHQRGVVHRDIKPSNVLVRVRDGAASATIIDFGIAKAVQGPLTAAGSPTRLGVLVGTPAYMSPEQIEGRASEIDARTDIYSLGVLLYELLTGEVPLDFESLDGDFSEIRRRLGEEQPASPSDRFLHAGPKQMERAAARGSDVAALRKQLRGDLDWITAKAMSKERGQRYAAASELAADVERHLLHQPVLAGPPSNLYLIGKFLRRHRFGTAAAALTLVLFLAGSLGTALGLVRARSAERAASLEAATAREVSEFLTDLFEVSDPGRARGSTITAREILDRGAKKVKEGLAGQPILQARLLTTTGSVYRKLGLYESAEPLLGQALNIRRAAPGVIRDDLAASLRELGVLYSEMGRYKEAAPLLEEALQLWRREPARPGQLAETLKERASLFLRTGDHRQAQPLYVESLQLARKHLGEEHPLAAWNLNDLGIIHMDRGEYDQAETLFLQSLELHRKAFGPDHAYVANNLNNLANLYQYRGEHRRVLPLRLQALEIYQKVLGAKHPLTFTGLVNLATTHQELGNFQTAETIVLEALDATREVLGEGHIQVALSLHTLSVVQWDQGRVQESEESVRKALSIVEKSLSPGDYRTGVYLIRLGDICEETGRSGCAEQAFRRALSILQEFSAEHLRTVTAQLGLGRVLRRRGNHAEATAALSEAEAAAEKILSSHPVRQDARRQLALIQLERGRLQRDLGDLTAAQEFFRLGLQTLQPLSELESVHLLAARAAALLEVGRVQEARPLVEKLHRTGFRRPDFVALCRENGVPLERAEAAAGPALRTPPGPA